MNNVLTAMCLSVCLVSVSGQVDIDVTFCDRDKVDYTVNNGNVGVGITYVETSDLACTTSITSATELVQVDFVACDATYTLDGSEAFIEFFITVQDNSNYNRATDKRFKVTCSFNTNSITVFETAHTSADAFGDDQKLVENTPAPVMSLYRLSDGSKLIDTDNNVTNTDSIIMEIELLPNLANYDMVVSWCYLEATGKAPSTGTYVQHDLEFVGTREAGAVNDMCPNIPVFSAFEYSADNWKASSTFEIFLPTMTDVTLTEAVTLAYTCFVVVCIEGHTGCEKPTCGTRRRREAGAAPDNSTLDYMLNDHATMTFGDMLPTASEGGTKPADNDMCLNIRVFFAVLGALIFLMLASCLLTCYMFVMARRRRERKVTERVYIRPMYADVIKSTESVSTEESTTGSTTAIVKPVDTGSDGWVSKALYSPYNILPRFVRSSGSVMEHDA